MRTLKQILDAANEKNFTVQIYEADKTKDGSTLVGFTKNNIVWYWYKSFEGMNDIAFFNERYNSANGTSYTTFNQNLIALKHLGLW